MGALVSLFHAVFASFYPEDHIPKVWYHSKPAKLFIAKKTEDIPTVDLNKDQIHEKYSALAKGASDGTTTVSMSDFVRQNCPSLFDKPFIPSWWLPKYVCMMIYLCYNSPRSNSGHAQTFYCVMDDFTLIDQIEYDR